MSGVVDEEALALARKRARNLVYKLKDEDWAPDSWPEIARNLEEVAEGFANGDAKSLYTYSRICYVAKLYLCQKSHLPEGREHFREFMSLLDRQLLQSMVPFLNARQQIHFGGQIDHEDNCDIVHNLYYIFEIVGHILSVYPGA